MQRIKYIIILLSVIFILFSPIIKAVDPDVYFRTEARDAMAKSSSSSSSSSSSKSKELRETGDGGSSELNLNVIENEIKKVGGDSPAVTVMNKILGVVTVVIVSASIIVIITKGVTFMQAAPEGKAEIKKQMISVMIGGIIIFSINTIIQIVINVSSKLIP